MRIGIDFDNTIACYSHLFSKVGFDLGFLPDAIVRDKELIKERLFEEGEQGHYKWRRIQGLLYGKYMPFADVMPGVREFLASCKKADEVELFIVSHKTQHGHYDEDKIDLQEAALKWLQKNGITGASDSFIQPENIYFEPTRALKIERIKKLQCSHFIDDLLVVLNDQDFPETVEKYNFTQSNALSAEENKMVGHGDWYRLSKLLLSPR